METWKAIKLFHAFIVEHDANWVKHFMMMEVDGTRQI